MGITLPVLQIRRSRWIGGLSILAVLLLSASVSAGPHEAEPAALSWVRGDAAAECPGGPDIANLVEKYLGSGTLVPMARAALVVEASIEGRPGGGFRVAIKLVRGELVIGRRELESADPDCMHIVGQAALAIAVTIDPEAAALPSPPMVSEQPATPPPQATASSAPEQRAAPRAEGPRPTAIDPEKPAEPWQGDLELAVGVATGILPRIAPGFAVRGRVRPPGVPFAVELEGGYFPPKSVERAPGKGAEFELMFVGLAVCNRVERNAVIRVSACVGPELAGVAAGAFGYDKNPQFWAWTLALSARGRLGFRPAPGLAVVIGPNIVVPSGRDYFQAVTPAGKDELFRMKPVGVVFELGGIWEFP